MVNHFLPKSSKFCVFSTDFVQISAAYGSNTYKKKTNTKQNKTKQNTVANAATRGLKFLHTLFDTYLHNMLAKFEPNRMVQNVQNFEGFFLKKKMILSNHFWQSVDALLQDVSVAETNVEC